jgi:hypothetical protein
MSDLKLTPSLLSMLERIEKHSGTLLMTPPTLSGNARCAGSARHPHPSCEAKQLRRARSDQTSPNLTPRLIPIEHAAPTVPHFPRFRASALFRRRSSSLWPASSLPASENLHRSRPVAVSTGLIGYA